MLLESNVYRQVSNKGTTIDVNLAGTKLGNRRLRRRFGLDKPGKIDDNKIIELGRSWSV